MRIALSIALLSLAACSTADATKSEGSSKPSGTTAGAADTAKPAATEAAPAVAAPPTDPLDDSGKVVASCDHTNVCTEHYNLGFGAEQTQKACGPDGKWAKGSGCPKDGRVGVCRTNADRIIYYKGSKPEEVGNMCTAALNGTWAASKAK